MSRRETRRQAKGGARRGPRREETPRDETPREETGRASRRPARRLDLTVVLAVLVPLLLVGALLTVRGGTGGDDNAAEGPTAVALPQAVAVCPSGTAAARVGAAGGGSGPVSAQVLPRGAENDVDVDGGAPAEVPGSEADGDDQPSNPVVLSVDDDLAPALVAGRVSTPLAAGECLPPTFDVWFTGVGAGPEHGSTLELTNPDAGPAVVAATVLGRRGEVDEQAADDLRGIQVPGRSTVQVDLAEALPRRGELAVHVQTLRGRVVADVLDRQDPLGGGDVVRDYVPSQAEPSEDSLVLGPPAGEGDQAQTLVLANPGDDETRAALQVVTATSQFAPEGLDDVVVPPQTAVTVDVGDVLAGGGKTDVLGLRVTADAPVTTSLRSQVDDDLAVTTPAEPVSAETTAVLPAIDGKRLVLGGATARTTVEVTPVGADGQAMETQSVDLSPGRAATLDLPDDAVLVSVDPGKGSVQGVVTYTDDSDGVAVQRLRPLVTKASVPSIRPGTG